MTEERKVREGQDPWRERGSVEERKSEHEHEHTVFLACYFGLTWEWSGIVNLEELNGERN